MFLRVAFSILLLFATCAQAQSPIPGVRLQKYKLQLLTKELRGVKVESQKDPEGFCGDFVHPEVNRVDGQLVLQLNSGLGFEWRRINEVPGELSEGCLYPVEQEVSTHGEVSTLVLVNGEKCENGKEISGSQRDTLELAGSQITYRVESVKADASGRWQNVPGKEGFTCVWTLAD